MMVVDVEGLHHHWKLQTALADIERAIEMAHVRIRPTAELIDQVLDLMLRPDRDQIIYRLEEIELTATEAANLAEKLETAAAAWDKLRSAEKQRADGVLARILRTLPEPHRSRIALNCLVHPRKRRREAAYKIIRDIEVPAELIEHLLELFEAVGDERLLHVIARNPPLVIATDEQFLLDRIEDPYWQMRVIEALLRETPERAVALSSAYPQLFVHAVGRLIATEYLPLLRQLFQQHRTDTDFLGIYAWALGRVGNLEALEELRATIKEIQNRLEPPGA